MIVHIENDIEKEISAIKYNDNGTMIDIAEVYSGDTRVFPDEANRIFGETYLANQSFTLHLGDDDITITSDVYKKWSYELNGPLSLSWLFKNERNITSVDFSEAVIADETSMVDCFNGCSHLISVNFGDSHFSVTSLVRAFYGCPNLVSIDLGNIQGECSCYCAFYACTQLREVNIASIKANNFSFALENCNSLEYISVGSIVSTGVDAEDCPLSYEGALSLFNSLDNILPDFCPCGLSSATAVMVESDETCVSLMYEKMKIGWYFTTSGQALITSYTCAKIKQSGSSVIVSKQGYFEPSFILDKAKTIVIDEERKRYAVLHRDSHIKFADNTPWDQRRGNAFKWFPRVYYRGYKNKLGEDVIIISSDDIGGHYWEESFIGKYIGYIDGENKLRSISGVDATIQTPASSFYNAAKALGSNYNLVGYEHHCLLGALALINYSTPDSEEYMGPGLMTSGSTSNLRYTTGTCDAIGDHTGKATYSGINYEGQNAMQSCLWGIEGLGGSVAEIRAGVIYGANEVRIYPAKEYDGTDRYTGERIIRKEDGGPLPTTSNNGRFMTKMRLGEYVDFIPTEITTASDGAWKDGVYSSTTASPIVLFSGAGSHGKLSGLYEIVGTGIYSNSVGNTICARLAFYGDISEYTEVDGSTFMSD